MISLGTPFDCLFAELSSRMRVPVTADTSPSNRPRVVVEEMSASGEEIRYRRGGEKTIARHAYVYAATCYAASPLEVSMMVEQIHGHVDEIAGPPQGCNVPGHDGYKIGKIGPVQGGDGTAAQYARTVEITLYRPVASQIRAMAMITNTTITATAEGAGEASLEGQAGE